MMRILAAGSALMLFGCAAGEPPTSGNARPAGSDVSPVSGVVSDSGAYPEVGVHVLFLWDDTGEPFIDIDLGAVRRAGEEWGLAASVSLRVAQARPFFHGQTVSGAPYGLAYMVGGTYISRDIDGLRLGAESTGRATLDFQLSVPRSQEDGVGRIVPEAEPMATARFEGRFNVTCLVPQGSGAVANDPRFETPQCRDLAVDVGLAATPLMPL